MSHFLAHKLNRQHCRLGICSYFGATLTCMHPLGRTQEFLNVVVQDIFGGLDMEDKMDLVKR